MFRTASVALLLGVLFSMSACTHGLEIVNMSQIPLTASHGPRQKIAILPFEGDDQGDPAVYGELVADGFRKHPAVEGIRTDWDWDHPDPGFTPDAVVEIKVHSDYSGSGWNYLITFPGFLIFTPAWNGFVYHANLTTEVNFYRLSDRKLLEKLSIPTEYSMRHCDFGRGFWASIGWWTPGYGAASAITAFYMLSYDDDATQPFQEKVARPYGAFIAESILRPVLARAKTSTKGSPLASVEIDAQ